MKRTQLYLFLFFLFQACSYAYAHVDTTLSLATDGTVKGFSSKYPPIKFEVKRWIRDSKLKDGEIRYSVGDSSIMLPNCLKSFFNNLAAKDVSVGGSWYHSSSTLPPYINLQFTKDGIDHSMSFSVKPVGFLNLRKDIRVTEKSSKVEFIKAEELCSATELTQLKVR